MSRSGTARSCTRAPRRVEGAQGPHFGRDTVINARAEDFPGSLVNDGDTVSTVVWYWADGLFVNE